MESKNAPSNISQDDYYSVPSFEELSASLALDETEYTPTQLELLKVLLVNCFIMFFNALSRKEIPNWINY
jgi:hypothetical protein